MSYKHCKKHSTPGNGIHFKKCILLCANCHAEYHAGLISVSQTSTYKEIKTLNEVRTKALKKCNKCGKSTTNIKFCSYKCSRQSSRKVDWDAVDLLSLLIQYKNLTKIAKILEVTHNAVKKRAIVLNLDYRKYISVKPRKKV